MENKSMSRDLMYEAVAETSVLYGNDGALSSLAFYHGLYAMEAAGAEGLCVKARIHVPSQKWKSHMARLKQKLRETSKREGIPRVQIETAVNGALAVPEVAVTVSGLKKKMCGECGPGEIVVTGWAGAEGMLRILSEKREELSARFAPAFLREAERFSICLQKGRAADAIKEAGGDAILHVGGGGVLGALWRLAENTGCGMEIELKAIPVLQQTIEVCEYFRLNPYLMSSAGCFLFTVPDGKNAVGILERKGIPARVIGRTVAGKGKIIRNGEDIRYLDRPAPDEIYKIFTGADEPCGR